MFADLQLQLLRCTNIETTLLSLSVEVIFESQMLLLLLEHAEARHLLKY